MSSRSRAVPSKSKRSRSRKRRPQPAQGDDGVVEIAGDLPASGGGSRSKRSRSEAKSGIPTSPRFGERPRPPWHPVPLSELLIIVGAVGLVVGLRHGPGFGTLMLASLIAVALGTLKVTLREHLSGYRSHTIMLAALPVVIFHAAVALGVSTFTRVTQLENVGILAVDIALFFLLFRVARARFLTARTISAGRR